MEVKAKNTFNMSPRKVNLVASVIRNKKAQDALKMLHFVEQRAGAALSKTLASAIANAVNNNKLDAQNLLVKRVDVVLGIAYKRFRPSTRGRVHPYKKRTTHVTIVLEGYPSAALGAGGKELPNGTKS